MTGGVHRPDVYGEGSEEERRAAAIARARTERRASGQPERLMPEHLTGQEITDRMMELGRANAAQRTENRRRHDAHLQRMDAQMLRRNRLQAMRWITTDFADFATKGPDGGPPEIDHPEVADWAAGACAGEPDWLFLLGSVGVGKTHQAVAAYAAVVADAGCDGYAVRVSTLLLRSLPSEPDRLPWTQLEDADLLLLDDVPGNLSEWDRRVLHRIVDTRQGRQRRTILTSNLQPATVSDHLGERLMSRLSYRTRLVGITGPDLRLHPERIPARSPRT
jgi:DNA replication protein DnaC